MQKLVIQHLPALNIITFPSWLLVHIYFCNKWWISERWENVPNELGQSSAILYLCLYPHFVPDFARELQASFPKLFCSLLKVVFAAGTIICSNLPGEPTLFNISSATLAAM